MDIKFQSSLIFIKVQAFVETLYCLAAIFNTDLIKRRPKGYWAFAVAMARFVSVLTGLFCFSKDFIFLMRSVIPDTCVDWDREPRLLEALQV